MTPRPLKIQGYRPSTGLSSVRWSDSQWEQTAANGRRVGAGVGTGLAGIESPGLLEGTERGQGRFPSCPSLLPQESSSPRAQALWRVERATSRDPRRAADRRCYCPLLMRSYVGRGTLRCCCTAAGTDERGRSSVTGGSVLGLFWLSGAPPGRIK
ncbi:hypothetical protein CCHR01_08624 [Colletotrichum chrysophilum]|uniref:Uncharacterized protein n=1 Tax=Colletotrichum chrysophilum TaxID=1836956 RepID=A0AAD9AN56_9PEZI|nr:hypothetical protein CCHR01_08624 [Colletotrichum chrysophilum]